ncbi:hypothetical protein [Ruania halotolerans]|uniref:hypothetical protein n=1 Tax=Ruania halotolerans TaxID=2897773 RepID=UPI001E426D69|nr:hypothetical protein [Ruania halotolerans]UFU05486.1 hypothetical protein LQF10_13655 [Ruania halotolerans]
MLAVLIFIAWGIVKMYRPATIVVRFLDRLIGAPGRPGLLDRMAALEVQVQRIHTEVTPNHGGSMNDAVRRLERRQQEDVDRLTEHLKVAERDQRRIDEVAESVEEIRKIVED